MPATWCTNTRTALDHVLARLKDHFGGDAGRGSFPTWQTRALWDANVTNARRGALDGLDAKAVAMIYAEQPLHRAAPAQDPLVVLNNLDNDDKHRLLHHGFAYPTVERGVDLIQVKDPKVLMGQPENVWTASQPLGHDTVLARYRLRALAAGQLRADPKAEIKLSTGPLEAPKLSYDALIQRVRHIADKAAALIETR
jgi:hypothetical protein